MGIMLMCSVLIIRQIRMILQDKFSMMDILIQVLSFLGRDKCL